MNIIKAIFHSIFTTYHCTSFPLVLTCPTKPWRSRSVLQSFQRRRMYRRMHLKKTILYYLSSLPSFDTFLKTKTLRTSGGAKLHARDITNTIYITDTINIINIKKTNKLTVALFVVGTCIPFIILTNPSLETAMSYQKDEKFVEAIRCYNEVLMHEPHNANAWFNIGYCHLALGEGTKALNAFNTISSALPAQYNIAYTYKTIGDLDKAIELYKKILINNPDYEPAHLALGIAYLTSGDFEQGWKQHERYLKRSGKNADTLRSLIKTNTIANKNILLRYEGGLGDTLLFIRYAERLKNMGARTIVSCQEQLIPLLTLCPYIDQLVSGKDPLPAYDADATLMSLPAVFNDTDKSVPKKIPYLYTTQKLIDTWQQKLAADHNFKIGICWQVNTHNDTSRIPIARRGCPLNQFATLSTIPGITFYSLQKYDGTEEINKIPETFQLNTFDSLDEETGPFMETAALMKNLDLIITVDTAIVHLAGGLGCPVWLLHPYATADWRWICHQTNSYWYPTVRIFKQQKAFDWENVIEEVKKELLKIMS